MGGYQSPRYGPITFDFEGCVVCPDGYGVDDTGFGCVACDTGSFGQNGTCAQCLEGSYSLTTGCAICTLCQPGFYQDKTNQTQCFKVTTLNDTI